MKPNTEPKNSGTNRNSKSSFPVPLYGKRLPVRTRPFVTAENNSDGGSSNEEDFIEYCYNDEQLEENENSQKNLKGKIRNNHLNVEDVDIFSQSLRLPARTSSLKKTEEITKKDKLNIPNDISKGRSKTPPPIRPNQKPKPPARPRRQHGHLPKGVMAENVRVQSNVEALSKLLSKEIFDEEIDEDDSKKSSSQETKTEIKNDKKIEKKEINQQLPKLPSQKPSLQELFRQFEKEVGEVEEFKENNSYGAVQKSLFIKMEQLQKDEYLPISKRGEKAIHQTKEPRWKTRLKSKPPLPNRTNKHQQPKIRINFKKPGKNTSNDDFGKRKFNPLAKTATLPKNISFNESHIKNLEKLLTIHPGDAQKTKQKPSKESNSDKKNRVQSMEGVVIPELKKLIKPLFSERRKKRGKKGKKNETSSSSTHSIPSVSKKNKSMENIQKQEVVSKKEVEIQKQEVVDKNKKQEEEKIEKVKLYEKSFFNMRKRNSFLDYSKEAFFVFDSDGDGLVEKELIIEMFNEIRHEQNEEILEKLSKIEKVDWPFFKEIIEEYFGDYPYTQGEFSSLLFELDPDGKGFDVNELTDEMKKINEEEKLLNDEDIEELFMAIQKNNIITPDSFSSLFEEV